MNTERTPAIEREAWEGENGMFCIKGWNRVMRMEPKVADKVPKVRAVEMKLPRSATARTRRWR